LQLDVEISVRGFSDDEAQKIRAALKAVMERFSDSLDYRRMTRIIVTTEFAEDLAELLGDTSCEQFSTHTNEDYAVAVAKVLTLPHEEDYEIVPVFGHQYMTSFLHPNIESTEEVEDTGLAPADFFRMSVHGVHHELSHVHDENKKLDVFNVPALSTSYVGKEQYTYSLAEACWSEYITNFFSSASADAASVNAMVDNFHYAIVHTKPSIDREILSYRTQRDLLKPLNSFERHGVFLAKSAAYILGYVDGLNRSLYHISQEASELLEGSYFESTWKVMHKSLLEMRQLYPNNWQDPSIYDSLASAMANYYADMGLVLSTTPRGEAYLDLPFRPETTP
jgi:hypothetical protein